MSDRNEFLEPDSRIPAGAHAAIIPTDRREFLRQLAAATVLTVPVAAAVAAHAGSDPVFAAIENHRRLEAAYGEASHLTDEVAAEEEGRIITAADHEIFGAAEEAADEALETLLATVPTTVAGVRAMLTYIFDKSGWEGADREVVCVKTVLSSPVLGGGSHV